MSDRVWTTYSTNLFKDQRSNTVTLLSKEFIVGFKI